MGAVFRAVRAAAGAFAEPDIQRLVWRAAIGTLIAMALLTAGLALGLPPLIAAIPDSGIGWLDRAVDWAASISLPFVAIIAIWWVFPAMMAAILSIFVDEVIDITERRHYPQAIGRRKVSFIGEILRALWLGLKLLIVHLMLVPFYLLLLFTAIGPFILYLAVNAYFLGEEFFATVALRHHDRAQLPVLLRRWRPQIWTAGFVMAAVAAIPVVNLVSAIFAAALATHLYHELAGRSAHQPLPSREADR